MVLAGSLAAGSLVLSGTSSAATGGSGSAADPRSSVNAVIAWDLNAQEAIWDVAGQQPQVQARSFAMVHGAVYDAVNAIADPERAKIGLKVTGYMIKNYFRPRSDSAPRWWGERVWTSMDFVSEILVRALGAPKSVLSPSGHTRPQWILPFGGQLTVDGRNQEIWANYA
jgi:hypothetical protein